jgi:hypothetical protein
MITVVELEEIIARTPAGEQIVYDGREIGSTDAIGEKLSRLKLSRTDDPNYVIFVGVDKSGEYVLTAFSTMGGRDRCVRMAEATILARWQTLQLPHPV